ncbi:unnamed protein product [Didymodactylos carnosus]|uniref:Uncharacterized protein n=1 Tax=Didymodactylos carnosus TaxID=1234261 RepID=A0A814AD37_9BILA|nr:unnamed protein product [Didymodactylos carnosus]CAF0912544.1 unnamed protein product [Didymodactylos carnosus]CAF3648714.1 unnamed protein product [Didymodactylos carnosus]CAF3693340.1 unnamed protein product [Didymodactylos carnosus]
MMSSLHMIEETPTDTFSYISGQETDTTTNTEFTLYPEQTSTPYSYNQTFIITSDSTSPLTQNNSTSPSTTSTPASTTNYVVIVASSIAGGVVFIGIVLSSVYYVRVIRPDRVRKVKPVDDIMIEDLGRKVKNTITAVVV